MYINEKYREIFKDLLSKVRGKVDFCDLCYVRKYTATFSRRLQDIKGTEEVKCFKGIRIRVLKRGAWITTHTEDTHFKALEKTLAAVVRAAQSAKGKEILPPAYGESAVHVVGSKPSEWGVISKKWAKSIISMPKLSAKETE